MIPADPGLFKADVEHMAPGSRLPGQFGLLDFPAMYVFEEVRIGLVANGGGRSVDGIWLRARPSCPGWRQGPGAPEALRPDAGPERPWVEGSSAWRRRTTETRVSFRFVLPFPLLRIFGRGRIVAPEHGYFSEDAAAILFGPRRADATT
jgi:hypothetical protein